MTSDSTSSLSSCASAHEQTPIPDSTTPSVTRLVPLGSPSRFIGGSSASSSPERQFSSVHSRGSAFHRSANSSAERSYRHHLDHNFGASGPTLCSPAGTR